MTKARSGMTLAILAIMPSVSFANYNFPHKECFELLIEPVAETTYPTAPTADFDFRDQLPQTHIPEKQWRVGTNPFGPCSLPYPQVVFPVGVDRKAWTQTRLIEAAKKWVGLPYRHYHFPLMGGLDCSNFTAWIYNYAFGIRFTSNVEKQAENAGRRLSAIEQLEPGDLIFLRSRDGKRISHVAMYVDEHAIIDSSRGGIQFRPFEGKYKERFVWARRIFSETPN